MAMGESSRRLSEAINRIVSEVSKRGYITGGDQMRIEIAVSRFIRGNFYPSFPESPTPIVKDLPKRIERTILCFSKTIMIPDEEMRTLCDRLAEWINPNYRKRPGKPWKWLGRGFKP